MVKFSVDSGCPHPDPLPQEREKISICPLSLRERVVSKT
jgi:hypothetical protein